MHVGNVPPHVLRVVLVVLVDVVVVLCPRFASVVLVGAVVVEVVVDEVLVLVEVLVG